MLDVRLRLYQAQPAIVVRPISATPSGAETDRHPPSESERTREQGIDAWREQIQGRGFLLNLKA